MIGHSNQGAPSQIWWEKSGNYDNHEAKKMPREGFSRKMFSPHLSTTPFLEINAWKAKSANPCSPSYLRRYSPTLSRNKALWLEKSWLLSSMQQKLEGFAASVCLALSSEIVWTSGHWLRPVGKSCHICCHGLPRVSKWNMTVLDTFAYLSA